jgi:hypothetical protein
MCFVIQGFFAVDQMSGEVTVMRVLDRDIAAVVRITVVVTDTTAPITQQGKGILYFIHLSSFLSLLLSLWKYPRKHESVYMYVY